MGRKKYRLIPKTIMKGKKRGKASCKTIYKYQKVERISPNGYLNFLREYKRRFRELSPQEIIRFGARQWSKMPLNKKERFKKNMVNIQISKFKTYASYIINILGTTCNRYKKPT